MSVLHITSGDISGKLIEESGVSGEVLVWHDVLYDGPIRREGFPSDDEIMQRCDYLVQMTGGGLDASELYESLAADYNKLKHLNNYIEVVFWFDACLFDLSMLAHLLTCIPQRFHDKCSLICVAEYDGIEPFNGLGQLSAEQIRGLYPLKRRVTEKQFEFVQLVDKAFAEHDLDLFKKIILYNDPPLKYFDKAIERWMKEIPSGEMQIGELERLAIDAVKSGITEPLKIFRYVSEHDSSPQYWGDITLWQKINGLADRCILEIKGPADRLPQWFDSAFNVDEFEVYLCR